MKRRGTRFFNKICDETMTQPKRIEAEGNRAKVMMGGEGKGDRIIIRGGKGYITRGDGKREKDKVTMNAKTI